MEVVAQMLVLVAQKHVLVAEVNVLVHVMENAPRHARWDVEDHVK